MKNRRMGQVLPGNGVICRQSQGGIMAGREDGALRQAEVPLAVSTVALRAGNVVAEVQPNLVVWQATILRN